MYGFKHGAWRDEHIYNRIKNQNLYNAVTRDTTVTKTQPYYLERHF